MVHLSFSPTQHIPGSKYPGQQLIPGEIFFFPSRFLQKIHLSSGNVLGFPVVVVSCVVVPCVVVPCVVVPCVVVPCVVVPCVVVPCMVVPLPMNRCVQAAGPLSMICSHRATTGSNMAAPFQCPSRRLAIKNGHHHHYHHQNSDQKYFRAISCTVRNLPKSQSSFTVFRKCS